MRALRSSLFSPHLEPMTTVVRDSDVIDTLESVRAGAPMSGYFVVSDLFEIDGDCDIVVATTAALGRMEAVEEEERNMAIMFYWATAQFQLLTGEGMVIMPSPAPLSDEQIRVVFEQIVKHPDYTHQGLVATSKDGVEVKIIDGEVK